MNPYQNKARYFKNFTNSSFPYLEIDTTLDGKKAIGEISTITPKQLKKLKPKSTWR